MKKQPNRPPLMDDPDMQGVMPALLRAVKRAHKIAHQTDTKIVTMRNGKIVHVLPDSALYNDEKI